MGVLPTVTTRRGIRGILGLAKLCGPMIRRAKSRSRIRTERNQKHLLAFSKTTFGVQMKDGSMKELKPSGIPKGARIIVFYQAKTKKVDGNKVKYYEIFEINTVK